MIYPLLTNTKDKKGEKVNNKKKKKKRRGENKNKINK